jgi:formylmethanofuran dehydrogenase subunit A
VLIGNDDYLLRLIAAGERAQAREYAAWLLGAAGGYALKVVNPGGVELWKRGARDRVGLDTPVGSDRVTPRAILETLVEAANALGLPHAAHIHCNDLGVAGNVATTLASMRALEGRTRAFHPLAVPRLRRRARRHAALRRAPTGRVRQRPSRNQRRRGTGAVRRRHDAQRRRRPSSTCCTRAAAAAG